MGIWLLLLALLNPVATGPGLPATGSPTQPVQVYELVRPAPAPPAIKARSAILLDLATGGALYQLDAHGRQAPASLLKVATALVALDHLRLEPGGHGPGVDQSAPLGLDADGPALG